MPQRPRTGITNEDQQLLNDLALASIRLHNGVLDISRGLARAAGIPVAGFQVLTEVLESPQTVSDVARSMGLTRQSVQRAADLLVDDGSATYLPNPAHKRAKLLGVSELGRSRLAQMLPLHVAVTEHLVTTLGRDEATAALSAVNRLAEAFEYLVVAMAKNRSSDGSPS